MGARETLSYLGRIVHRIEDRLEEWRGDAAAREREVEANRDIRAPLWVTTTESGTRARCLRYATCSGRHAPTWGQQ